MIWRAAQALLIATGALMSAFAGAQTFPSRSMTVVVGYAAGGQADILARKVAQQLGENLKTSVVVENRTGGNTLIASQSVVRAPSDGHTLLLTTDGMTTIDPMVPGGNGFDPLQAFDLVINLATAPLFLAAKKDLPVNSLAELIEYGKKNPTALHFGTSGPTTPHRIAGEMIKQLGGFQMSHVAYRGTSASVNDLAGGHIPLVIGAATALMPMASEGKIKIFGDHRRETICPASGRAIGQRDVPGLQRAELSRPCGEQRNAGGAGDGAELRTQQSAGECRGPRVPHQAGHERGRRHSRRIHGTSREG